MLICASSVFFLGWSNVFLISGVFITLTLTFTTLIENSLHWITATHVSAAIFEKCKLLSSVVIATIVMVMLFGCTDLGKSVKKSFTKGRATYPSRQVEMNQQTDMET